MDQSINAGGLEKEESERAVIHWLLESDPAIRWQVWRDLLSESGEVVTRERSRVATEGWGKLLLDRQRPDGKWGDGVSAPQWQSTLAALTLLWDMGIDPESAAARRAVGLVRDQFTWGPEFGDTPFSRARSSPASTAGCWDLAATLATRAPACLIGFWPSN